MPKETLVYRGWIGGREIDRIELEAIGVDVGDWNPIGTFDRCSMTVNVFWTFAARWKGRYVWGLIAKKELVYSKSELAKQAEIDDVDIPF